MDFVTSRSGTCCYKRYHCCPFERHFLWDLSFSLMLLLQAERKNVVWRRWKVIIQNDCNFGHWIIVYSFHCCCCCCCVNLRKISEPEMIDNNTREFFHFQLLFIILLFHHLATFHYMYIYYSASINDNYKMGFFFPIYYSFIFIGIGIRTRQMDFFIIIIIIVGEAVKFMIKTWICLYIMAKKKYSSHRVENGSVLVVQKQGEQQ